MEGNDFMKEFKKDKRELEIKIQEIIKEFCDKYDVELDDINFNKLVNFDGLRRYIISLKFDV